MEFNRLAAQDAAQAGSASFGIYDYLAFLGGSMLANDQMFNEATAQGQTALASSGDSGLSYATVDTKGTPDSALPFMNHPGPGLRHGPRNLGRRENQLSAFALATVPARRRTYPSETSASINKVNRPIPPPPCFEVELGGGFEGGGVLLAGIVTVTGLDWEESPFESVAIAVSV